MRAVIQRVKSSEVAVQNEKIAAIDSGLLILLGIGREDDETDIDYLINKIINLRIFEDAEGKMNLSALNLNKSIMVVSQFTLYGDCKKGRRPSFFNAAPPDRAEQLYDTFVEEIRKQNLVVATGKFQAMMDISLVNDGPVTLLIDSEKEF